MALYLVRHGETDWNRERRLQSRMDVALNPNGKRQAENVRRALACEGVEFAMAWCSPLGRARETAAIILRDSSAAVCIDERLMEISVGDFEGRREQDLRDELGSEFDSWQRAYFTYAAPGGETIDEAIERVRGLVEAIRGLAVEADVLCVAHQGINMAVLAALSGRVDVASLADFKQGNDQLEVWDARAGCRLRRVRV